MRARRLTTFAVVLVLGVLAACGDSGGSGGSGSGAGSTPSSSERRDSTPAAGEASLLAFTSPAIGGGTIDGASFQGRPTLLWFWSPW